MQSAALTQFTPPRAYIGLANLHAALSASKPTGALLPGVSNTGPNVMRSALQTLTSSRVWQDRKTKSPERVCRGESDGRCTPSAPVAKATSARELTRILLGRRL